LLGLDEWLGVGQDETGSCAQMLYDDFFTPMGFRPDQISVLDGKAENPINEIQKANRLVDELGIDFALLGIGMNGHVGLNEPGFNPDTRAQLVDLSETTRRVMKKYFGKETSVTQGITLGFSQLLEAKKIVLMATGERKATIVKEIVDSEISIVLPATVFKRRTDVQFYVDGAAGKRL
jgi:6-phosphogluconolactonase/glucosamine-6-phosphate isomerase/deaminase